MISQIGEEVDLIREVFLATRKAVHEEQWGTAAARFENVEANLGEVIGDRLHAETVAGERDRAQGRGLDWDTGGIDQDLHLLGASTAELADELTHDDEAIAPRHSPAFTIALRVSLSAALLAVLVWRLPDVKWADLGPRWSSSSPAWLAGAATTMALAFVLSALRWQRVLSAIRPAPPYRRMLSHFLAGQFVSNVLPTAFGGDVVRVTRLGRDLDDHPTAFASVTIERMTGWLVLPLISATAMALQPDLRSLGSATSLAIAIDAGTLAALITILLGAANRRFGTSVGNVSGWRRFLVAVHVGVDALRRNPKVSAEVVVVGAAFQTLQCVAVWMAAEAIGVGEVSIGVAFAFFPAAAIAQNLPIGLGGLGVREGIFVVFFGAVGAPRALSITLGLVVYALTIATSAFGAPAFAFGGRQPVPPVPDQGSQNPHTSDVTPPSGES